MNFYKKGLILFSIVFASLHTSAYALVSGGEKEQTVSFLDSLMKIVSTEMLLRLLFAVITIILTYFTAKIVKHRVFIYLEGKVGTEGTNKQEMLAMASRVVNISIVVTGVSLALGILGVEMSIFMGGIGFGIGFTLRTFLSNFIAGIIMVSQGIYHNGDLIQIESQQGKIVKINTLFTVAQQYDGVVFTIPNIHFLDKEVKNFYTSEKRRVDIDLHFDYDADIIKIKSTLKKVALSFDEVLRTPEPKVIVEAFDDSYIKVQFRPWIMSDENYISMKSNILETINLAFKQAGIDVAKQKITMISEKAS